MLRNTFIKYITQKKKTCLIHVWKEKERKRRSCFLSDEDLKRRGSCQISVKIIFRLIISGV